MAPSKKRGRKATAAATTADAAEEEAQEVTPAPKRNARNNKRKAPAAQGEASATESSRQPVRNKKRKATAGAQGEASTESSSKQPVIVFAHGAAANSKHEWMVRWRELLAGATNAVEVIAFDYPYLAGRKRGAPPKAETLIATHAAQVVKAAKKHPGHPVVLVGKSMGSRVGCMVAGQEDIEVAAVVCLGYPLKGTKGKNREETLLELKVPVMFVQGTKDSMCPLEKLEQVRRKLTVHHELHAIEGGDHSFKVGVAALRKSSLTLDEIEQRAARAVHLFLERVLPS